MNFLNHVSKKIFSPKTSGGGTDSPTTEQFYYETEFNILKESNTKLSNVFNKIIHKIEGTIEKLNENEDLKNKLSKKFLESLNEKNGVLKEAKSELERLENQNINDKNKNSTLAKLGNKSEVRKLLETYSQDRELASIINNSVNLFIKHDQSVQDEFNKIYSSVIYGKNDKKRSFNISMLARNGELGELITEITDQLHAIELHKAPTKEKE